VNHQYRSIVGAKGAVLRRRQMLMRRQQEFVDMSPAASLGLAAAWSGVVSGLLFVMIFVRLFS
jgi:ElaB/YqjD/DUF883 family membrane-anchored ribosome-binding protein